MKGEESEERKRMSQNDDEGEDEAMYVDEKKMRWRSVESSRVTICHT